MQLNAHFRGYHSVEKSAVVCHCCHVVAESLECGSSFRSPGHGLLLQPSEVSALSQGDGSDSPITSPIHPQANTSVISQVLQLSPPAEPEIPGIPPIPKPWEMLPTRSSLHIHKSPVVKRARAFMETKGKIVKKSQIYIPRLGLGVIAYVGNQYGVPMDELLQQKKMPSKWRDNLIVGVCLKDARGNNDGFWKNLKLFRCPPRHGVWLRYSEIADMRATERILLRYLTANDHDTDPSHSAKVINIVHLMTDFAFTCGAGQNAHIFRDIQNAVDSKDIVALKHALQEAFMCHIPPSAPKVIAGRRFLHELMAIEQIRKQLQKAIKKPHRMTLQKVLIEAKEAGIPPSDPLVEAARKLLHHFCELLEEEKRKKLEEEAAAAAAAAAALKKKNESAAPDPAQAAVQLNTERLSKSLSGRCDSGFFTAVQIYFLLEIITGGVLCAILLIDSAWAGFPLIVGLSFILFIVALDYLIMYFIAWTRFVMQIAMMCNVCCVVVMVQTLTGGHGQVLTVIGSIFCGVIGIKLLLMMQCKTRLVGKRKSKQQRDQERQRRMQQQPQRGFAGGATPVHVIHSTRRKRGRR